MNKECLVLFWEPAALLRSEESEIIIIIIIIIIMQILCFSLHLCNFTQGTFSMSLLRLPHIIIVECTNVAWQN